VRDDCNRRFRTGYSSLSYLKRFSVDRIKIDRAFIREIGVEEESEALTRAVIGLAGALKSDVIAEDVELDAHRRFLIAQGCTAFSIDRRLPATRSPNCCSNPATRFGPGNGRVRWRHRRGDADYRRLPPTADKRRESEPVRLAQFSGCFYPLTGGRNVKTCGDNKENAGDRPHIDRRSDADPACLMRRVSMECPEKAGNWQHQQEQSRPIEKRFDHRFLVRFRLHACLHEEWHCDIASHSSHFANTW
jgi:hypothetical protein